MTPSKWPRTCQMTRPGLVPRYGLLTVVFTTVLGLSISNVGSATTVERAPLFELIAMSGAIVEGTIAAVGWTPATNDSWPTTTYLLCGCVFDAGYGPPSMTADNCVPIGVPGGQEPDGTTSWIAGNPIFTVGDRVIVFLDRNSDYLSPFAGWWQGVFRLDKESYKNCVYDHAGAPIVGVDKLGNLFSSPTRSLDLEQSLAGAEGAKINFVSNEKAHAIGSIGAGTCLDKLAFVETIKFAANIQAVLGTDTPNGYGKKWQPSLKRVWTAESAPEYVPIGVTP